MKILLVGNYLNDRQESMQRFAESLRCGLMERGEAVTFLRPEAVLGGLRPGGGGLGKWLGYWDKFVLFPRMLRKHASQADVVHICDHSNAMYVGAVKSRPHLVTCNDLLAIRSARGEFPENPTRFTGKVLQSWILRGLKEARYAASISHATQRDLVRIAQREESAGEVIHMGMNQSFAPMAAPERMQVLTALFGRNGIQPPGRYIFHVGGDQWYKNRDGIITLFAEVVNGFESHLTLVMAGAPASAKHVRLIESLGISSRVLFPGSVSSEELQALYTGAEVLIFPSLAEGFGWPIVEAQACGCRVITSNRAPMDEVGGPSCLYIDPSDPAAGAIQVRNLLEEGDSLREIRIRAGFENARRFTTASMIDRYLQAYRKISSANHDRTTSLHRS